MNQFMPYAQKRMGFQKLPRIFLRDDPQNAQNPLGKTAYYDPEQMSVTLYINGRHPKDIMRSLSHELVHHTQNCNGQFDHVGEMGEGYAQNDKHLREMERQAYEQGNLVFRDWEDSIKGTIYNESLQKGAKKNMSTKDWKNNELRTLLSEKWGFSFNLLTESQDEEVVEEATEEVEEGMADARHSGRGRKPKLQKDRRKSEKEDEELDEGAASGRVATPDRAQGGDRREDDERKRPMEESEQVFAPNHYCVHHGGVQRNGSVELAEAVSHNYNEELGRVTHYDMKFADGTIMEKVAFEDIQVTNASLAEGHGSHPAKRDDDEELDEAEKPDFPDVDGDGDREEPISKASKEKKEKDGGKEEKSDKDMSKVPPQLRKHMKKKMSESQIREIIRKLVKEAMNKNSK
jgi:hypothetical protein